LRSTKLSFNLNGFRKLAARAQKPASLGTVLFVEEPGISYQAEHQHSRYQQKRQAVAN